MGNLGFVHVQCQLESSFQHLPTFFPNRFGLGFGAFDDDHKVIDIAAVGDGWLPLPVLSDGCASADLDTVVPVPSILPGLFAEVAPIQVLIEFMQHDIRQQRRYDAALRYAFTCCPEKSYINVT